MYSIDCLVAVSRLLITRSCKFEQKIDRQSLTYVIDDAVSVSVSVTRHRDRQSLTYVIDDAVSVSVSVTT